MLQPPDDYRLPELPTKIPLAAESGPIVNGTTLGWVVGGIAALGDLFAFGLLFGHDGRGLNMPFVVGMFVGWFTAGLGLLAVWLGLGRGRLYLRLLAVGMIGVLLIGFAYQGPWRAEIFGEAFAALVLLVAAAALPFGPLYLFGFELTSAAIAPPIGETKAGQFSLRQLFGWTVAATLVASVARFAHLDLREWTRFGVTAAVFSLIAVGAACAALMPGRNQTVVLRLVVLGASTVMLTCGIFSLFSRTHIYLEELADLALISLEHVFLMSFVLLLYRRLGYRLRRRGWLVD